MLTSVQLETLPDVASIDIQTEIQWFMRPYLLDFLIEAHTAFGLLEETLFLTVNLLDRYCSKRIVYKNHYQLVGCAALLIAAKYGDRKERVPTIKELRVMCCNLYDDDMFTQMEWHVLQTLQWVIGHPTVDSFHQLALETFPYDAEVEHLATYLSEIAMFEREFVSKRPSDVARASLALARAILPNRSQPLHADWASKYDTDTLVCLSRVMHKPTPVLSRKYATMEKARVSIILEDFLEKQAAIARYQATAPPTPPCEVNPSSNVGRTQYAGPYTTPTKTHLPVLPTGCLTPPITPTNPESATQYHQHPSYTVGPARPLTPQSATMKSAPQYSYGLPPVSMMTSGY